MNGPIPRMRMLPCACGGVVRAEWAQPAAGVAAHNRSRRHQEWRQRRELEGEKVTAEKVTVACRHMRAS